MGKVQVSIKNVDEAAFAALKAEAARRKLNVGAAFSLAISKWVFESRKPLLPLTNWKTIKGGTETKNLSKEVDSILYG